MIKTKSKLTFASGIPTAPDVKNLRTFFGVLKVGDILSYSDISETIKCAKGSFRWVSVVMAWRKELYRELNIVLIPESGIQYKVADSSERVHLSSAKYKGSLRGIVRAGDVASKTSNDGLSPEELRAKDHVVRSSATLRLAAATQAKELNYSPTK